MRKILFSQSAPDSLKMFKTVNPKLVFKVELITDMQRNPFEGLGKPEPLKANFSGYWSGRITDEHRLIYMITDDMIEIYSCSRHY